MREIKFRAWNECEKIMEYDIQDEYDGDLSCFGDYITNEFWEVMQYTGLKDKNGIEIYEGDIVKTCEGNLYQVIWGDGFKFLYEFNIRGYDEKTILGLGDTSSRRWGVEVIGNIYENSELLRGEE